MSQEQLQSFLAQAKGDNSLQSQLKKAADIQTVEAIAREHGYEFTADRLSQASDEELEGVDGGLCVLSGGTTNPCLGDIG